MSGPALQVDILSTIIAEPQQQLAPFSVDLPANGRFRAFHGNVCFVGQIGEPGAMRIAIVVGLRGCGCGCNAPGRALMYTPSPENARTIAAQLIEQADAIEAEAAVAAADAFRKAAGQ